MRQLKMFALSAVLAATALVATSTPAAAYDEPVRDELVHCTGVVEVTVWYGAYSATYLDTFEMTIRAQDTIHLAESPNIVAYMCS
jgi:opacity protein-like surface antigen